MRRDLLRTMLFVGAAIAFGWIGWSGHVLLLPAALAFPMLWALAPNRSAAAFISAGYFLAASRGLPQGVATFYASDLWPGLLLWLVASGSFVAVHTALWSRAGTWRPVRLSRGRHPDGTPAVRHYRVGAPRHCGGCAVSGMGRARSCRHDDRPHGASRPDLDRLSLWPWEAFGSGPLLRGPIPKVPRHGVASTWQWGFSLGREAGLQRQHDLIATARGATSGGARTIVLPGKRARLLDADCRASLGEYTSRRQDHGHRRGNGGRRRRL
jgi:hypothetical protein